MGRCRELKPSWCSWWAERAGLLGPLCPGPACPGLGSREAVPVGLGLQGAAPCPDPLGPSPQAVRASTTRHPYGWSRCVPRIRAGTSARCSCSTSSTTKKKCKKAKWLSEKAIKKAVKRREVKSKGEKERYTHLNAEFQRIARREEKSLPQ